jgi:hypothetical protein
MVDIARGLAPTFVYQKGSPFNSALLFGVHLTVIGQISGGRADDGEERSYLSRGSSQVWTAPFASNYRSAWDKDGTSSIRIVMAGGRIVGALLMGNQRLADPLRQLVQEEADLSAYQEQLLTAGDDLPELVLRVYREWQQ